MNFDEENCRIQNYVKEFIVGQTHMTFAVAMATSKMIDMQLI